MTLIDRYLGKRLLGTLAKILVSLVLLFIVIDLLTHRQEDIIKYDIPWWVVIQYYLTFVPTILFEYHVAALAVLITGLMVLGRAAQDQEITAALAGGISLRRIAVMPILLAFVLAGLAFLTGETVGVRATKMAARIEREYFSRSSPGGRTGVSWTNLGDGWTCHVLKFNRQAQTGQDVYLHAITDDLVQEVRARRIYWDESTRQWMLEDGLWSQFLPQEDWNQQVRPIRLAAAPFNEPPEELFALEEPAETKSSRTLLLDLRRAERLGMPVRPYWIGYYAKFARPALCFVMIWLAIPFALRLRRGGVAIGFGVSIAIALAYLMLFYASIGLGHLGKLDPFLAAWLANFVFFALGVQLFRKTPT